MERNRFFPTNFPKCHGEGGKRRNESWNPNPDRLDARGRLRLGSAKRLSSEFLHEAVERFVRQLAGGDAIGRRERILHSPRRERDRSSLFVLPVCRRNHLRSSSTRERK